MQGLPFCPKVTTALTSDTIIEFCCFWISHKGHHSVGYSVFRGSSLWSHMAVFHSFPLILQWELAVPVSHFSLELCICLKQNLSRLWDLWGPPWDRRLSECRCGTTASAPSLLPCPRSGGKEASCISPVSSSCVVCCGRGFLWETLSPDGKVLLLHPG